MAAVNLKPESEGAVNEQVHAYHNFLRQSSLAQLGSSIPHILGRVIGSTGSASEDNVNIGVTLSEGSD